MDTTVLNIRYSYGLVWRQGGGGYVQVEATP